jgi:hypothetical protein
VSLFVLKLSLYLFLPKKDLCLLASASPNFEVYIVEKAMDLYIEGVLDF